ncbi:23S rRNA (uridine(2552)-2'-O)-methyltransferase [Enterobacteriaceae endosymbiont of Donacia bicoloricornis]|uniref:RlmE family RNA methyltransferase n=1 Tax=Enterobacteriaceae endosymbiont of Donacia bicoloricornis TaxID=2675772 RepID=UPI00144A1DD1|nr:SAM-dependent methyltransferase [Enterobacteriaceae endosymbiont of Donacia bicoloricornis]QJC37828.1 23S rRNA (uridine(2552)-2'-O)-methyltransferase [Enterobacteriaceae endosymbiont of Donacia bicoloricornis]
MNYKKKKSKIWLEKNSKDFYIKKVQKNINKYRSRSWFKLAEIEKTDKIFKKNMTIIDLGSSPGGWSSFASLKIGSKGKIIACDILPMNYIKNVNFYQGNICNPIFFNKIKKKINKTKIHLIMSDMSPNISGIKEIDIPRIIYLNELTLKLCYSNLEQNGSFLVKTFQGEELIKFYNKINSIFEIVKIRKPNASKSKSSEVYIVAKRYKN